MESGRTVLDTSPANHTRKTAVTRSLAIPPLTTEDTPSSAAARCPVFAEVASHRSMRSQPIPPAGPPPASAFGSVRHTTSDICDVLEVYLPSITRRSADESPDLRKSASAASLLVMASREKLELALNAEQMALSMARERINAVTKEPRRWEALLGILAEAHETVTLGQETERSVDARIGQDSLAHEEERPVEALSDVREGTSNFQNAWKVIEKALEGSVHDTSQRKEIQQLLAEVEGKTRARKQAAAKLKAEQIARDSAKAKRMADVRNFAKEVTRVEENSGNTAADDTERKEIERALAAVDETRRKRMERRQAEGGAFQQDEDKLRRRQVKREQLMKKRRDMEERLEEEANKMAQLTESAKKKGESKFMSEAAKKDAEERIRAEEEAVAQLERQAAEMAAQRASMQRQLAESEQKEVAEIEANASALKAKRVLVEARMRKEEEELKTLSESAKREVESKMFAEAAAIAEMEQQSKNLCVKRAELEVQVSNRLRLENTLLHESEAELVRKREAMKAKMQQEEEELQKLSDEAKRRVMEKMATEAATIADMERKAIELARQREALASQIVFYSDAGIDHKSEDLVDVSTLQLRSGDGMQAAGVGANDTADDSASIGEEGRPQQVVLNRDFNEKKPRKSVRGIPGSVSVSGVHSERSLDFDHKVVQRSSLASSPYEGHGQTSGPSAEPLPNAEDQAAGLGHELSAEEMIALNICAYCSGSQIGMSPAHVAAAAGHVVCLDSIQHERPALTTQLDSAGRSPLFYACANAHADAVEHLIRQGPQSCCMMDVNKDTSLHAAALAGSALSCQILLRQGRVEVEPRNITGLTPAHLAANNDVLEVLSQHGADLNAKDVDSRTPLFVACATDRLEKAEYLCELLECAGQDLGETDKRGDTPMHAAACNGSTACLLLLLQYGVAPDVRNLKGLRPIDLASRKGQSACEKILMEYQLHHHVNNSYFDSVLFLATLEGHKKCKEALMDPEGPETIAPSARDSPLSRPESVLSLNRGRSLRLRHWGDWIAYEDQNAKRVFWYNHVAQTSQWETPAGANGTKAGNTPNSSMRLKRAGDWIEYTMPDDNVFYYNENTNDFQWQHPDQMSPHVESREWPDEMSQEDSITREGETEAGGWAAFQDPSTGLVFWYNQVTGESRWDSPEEADSIDHVLQHELQDGHKASLKEVEIVREITCVDELFTPR